MKSSSRSALLSRRSFLKALGLSATCLPFYRMLENNFVLAQTGELPLKFLGLGFFHGTAGQLWSRQPGETDTAFSLTYPDSPFAPFDDPTAYGKSFKERVTIFEGFDFAVGEFDLDGTSMHVPMHGAMGLLMTGSCMHGQQLQNASVDQYLAAKYGGSTRFRSLQVRGFDQDGFPLDAGWALSFDSGGNALAPMHRPTEIWDKVFAGAIVGNDPEAQAAAARKRRIGASVLDFVAKDIQRMNGRLAGAEREKLDQHLTIVRGLERRLSELELSEACMQPPRRDPEAHGYVEDKFSPGNIRPMWDFCMEVLTEAIVCDLTRFATYLFPNETGPAAEASYVTNHWTQQPIPLCDGTEGWELPIYSTKHDECAHRLADGTGADAVFSQRMVAAVNRFYFARIAKCMQRLDAAGLLDSTVILAGSDGGHGSAHSTQQVPILLAGGANGRAGFGKRVVAPGRTARVRDWCSGVELASHNPVLVAVLNLFGEELTSYGSCGRTEFTQGVDSLLG